MRCSDELKAQREKVAGEIELLQKSLDELKGNVVSAIEIQEMLQSFGILFAELPPYIIKSIKVLPTHIEMGLFGRANLERFTLAGGVFAQTPNWLPEKYLAGNKLNVEKTIRKCLDVLPDLKKTPFGGRLRFLRRRQGLTQEDLCRRTGISRATICKLERGGGATLHPEIVGKLLAYFGQEAAEAFPEGKDGVDHFVPVTDFGSWLRNFRVRKGLQQVELAKILGVSNASVSAYEKSQTRPRNVVLKRMRKVFKLSGEFDRFL